MFSKASCLKSPWTKTQQRKARRKKVVGVGLLSTAIAAIASAVAKEHNRP